MDIFFQFCFLIFLLINAITVTGNIRFFRFAKWSFGYYWSTHKEPHYSVMCDSFNQVRKYFLKIFALYVYYSCFNLYSSPSFMIVICWLHKIFVLVSLPYMTRFEISYIYACHVITDMTYITQYYLYCRYDEPYQLINKIKNLQMIPILIQRYQTMVHEV